MRQDTQILRVESGDISALGEMLYQTKLSLSINRLLWRDWPNEPAQRAQYTSSIRGGFEDPNMEDFKIVDTKTQKILGYMIMAKKQPAETPGHQEGQQAQDEPDIPECFNPEVYTMVMEQSGVIDAEWKNMAHYEIVYIVVNQQDRGRGLGSQLMKVCFDKAGEAGLPVVVGSEPMAYPFFKRLGFEDRKHVDMDLARYAPPFSGYGAFRLAGMIRQSGASSA